MNRPALLILAGTLLLPAAARPNDPPARAELLKVLSGRRVSVEFDQTPAREALGHLGRMLGISIVGRYSDERSASGIDPATPITLQVTDGAPIEVLERILDQCADLDPCTWQIRQGCVEVGTKARLSVPAAQETRVYQVRDLLFSATSFDNAPDLDIAAALAQSAAPSGGGGGGGSGGEVGGGGGPGGGSSGGSIIHQPGVEPARPDAAKRMAILIDLIVNTVEPASWEAAGGPATITPFEGTLVVRARTSSTVNWGGAAEVAKTCNTARFRDCLIYFWSP